MANAINSLCGLFLAGALLLGCSNPTPAAGCVIQEVVLDQCVNTPQCPSCAAVCEDMEGTRVGGPQCAQFVGSGFFCTCLCEFCFDGDGDGGSGEGGDGSAT
jgi:hypothetical protein